VPAVLDASALLALVKRELGQDVVEAALISGAVICTVNLTEVITTLLRDGVPEITVRQTLDRLPIPTADFDNDLAMAAGLMSSLTRKFGLSLGDRACLALAQRENLPVLTGDRAWAQAGPLVGVTVRLIR
jgi:PIN domain nuclease of toxin-antitoxin system